VSRETASLRALVATLALASAPAVGCDRDVPGTRLVHFGNLPACAPGAAYERPLVVRLDRDPALFEEAWTAQLVLAAPTDPAQLELPRRRMRLTLRVGLCPPTSIGTWDCAAPTWLGSGAFDTDTRAATVEQALPKIGVSCVPVGRLR
jgi:hypothetical protein